MTFQCHPEFIFILAYIFVLKKNISMKRFIPIALFCLFSISLAAQSINSGTSNVSNTGDLYVSGQRVNTGDLVKSDKGSPYMDDAFTKGFLVKKNGKKTKAKLRFNVRKDQMEAQMNNNDVILVDQSAYETITLDGKTFKRYPIVTGNKAKLNYFEILSEGRNTLLVHRSSFIHLGKTGVGSMESTPDRMIIKTNYYTINDKSKVPAKLKKKKKSVLALFGENARKAQNFAKKNKLKFKKAEDLKKIFDFCNAAE